MEKMPLSFMGDFNAKIRSDNTGIEEVIRPYGLGDENDNGESQCVMNNLVMGGSVFPYKRIHEATWTFPQQRKPD